MRTTTKRTAGRRSGSESGVILLLACFCMPVMISMLGLGVDLSILYSIKARLQMACDGAAVAGERALSLAQDSNSQATAASNIARQWFTANFAGGYLGAYETTVPAINIGSSGAVRTVSVSASTKAPAYFMKYWGRAFTLIGASGQVARRDVVIMMVLDRSGSMNDTHNTYGGLLPCQVMVQAAKQFTGMFQETRDRIGLATFAETVQVVQSPTTSFQAALGYTNASGRSTGALDSITCQGGTNTSAAVSLAWNELYKSQLPAPLNVLLVFTDGTPTAGTFSMVVPASADPTNSAQSALLGSSSCVDRSGLTASGGGDLLNNPRNWINREANSGSSISLGTNSYWGSITGPVAAIYSDLTNMYGLSPFFSPAGTNPATLENTTKDNSEATGCAFLSTNDPSSDMAFIPAQDFFGNLSTGYRTGLTTTYVQRANRISVNPTNIGNLVFNLADNAANSIRGPHVYSNSATMPGTLIYTIGLGGNTGGVDFQLLQRMANDDRPDPSGNANTAYNASQPTGRFLYSPDASQLQRTFTQLGSMILRISR